MLLIVWLKVLRSYKRRDELFPYRLRIEHVRYLLHIIEADKSIREVTFYQKIPIENTVIANILQLLASHLIQAKLLQKQVGPLHPITSHKSDDGRAFVTVKRSAVDETLICYLSVGLKNTNKLNFKNTFKT